MSKRKINDMSDKNNKLGIPSIINTSANSKVEANSERAITAKELTSKVDLWLNYVGLKFNPFNEVLLDAGSDPHLPNYLVGHEAFNEIWADRPTFVFAPIGGGKTAFRVRLARACRIGQDNRRIFPIVYKFPSPSQLESKNVFERHQAFLLHSIATELLLTFAYKPEQYFRLAPATQRKIERFLFVYFPKNLAILLMEIYEACSLEPLVEPYAPTAHTLFSPPDPKVLRVFCEHLLELENSFSESSSEQIKADLPAEFQSITQLIVNELDYEAIYLLVDGVDAYVETSDRTSPDATLLKPLVKQTKLWADTHQIYSKFFLPIEFADALRSWQVEDQDFAIIDENTVNITWSVDMLKQMLAERLQVASGGMFNSLDAICAPVLIGKIEQHLLLLLGDSQLPREYLALAGRLVVDHVRHSPEPCLIDRFDPVFILNNYK